MRLTTASSVTQARRPGILASLLGKIDKQIDHCLFGPPQVAEGRKAGPRIDGRKVILRGVHNEGEIFVGKSKDIDALITSYRSVKIIKLQKRVGDTFVGFNELNQPKDEDLVRFHIRSGSLGRSTGSWWGFRQPRAWIDEYGKRWNNGDVILDVNSASSFIIRNGRPLPAAEGEWYAEFAKYSEGDVILGRDLASSFTKR